jgi:hypothetical protein
MKGNRMFLDKYNIPQWLEVIALAVTGIVLGCMFAYGILDL